MLHLINEGIDNLKESINKKKLFVWGGGKRGRYLYRVYELEGCISCFVDNNIELQGSELHFEHEAIQIIGVEEFSHMIEEIGVEEAVLLVTPRFYVVQILEQLDSIAILDGLDCYLGVLMEDLCHAQKMSFTKGTQLIPKKIHYCWFGKKKIPEHLQNYISGWKKLCNDYEIIQWNEDNYDISKNQYMKEAYDCKKWGFVPDYARLDIIYNEGGIYFDTDVELLKSPDQLLYDQMFCGLSNNISIALGLGFGAVKHNQMIKSMKAVYDNKSFFDINGKMNLTTCIEYQLPIMLENGFVLKNEYQKIRQTVLYPSEVFSPYGVSGIYKNKTDNTIAIHHSEVSWGSETDRTGQQQIKDKLSKRLKEVSLSTDK